MPGSWYPTSGPPPHPRALRFGRGPLLTISTLSSLLPQLPCLDPRGPAWLCPGTQEDTLCSLVPAFLQQNALFYFSKVGFCWVPGFASCYQSILKEIKSECSLAGLRLKLKLEYFGHLM